MEINVCIFGPSVSLIAAKFYILFKENAGPARKENKKVVTFKEVCSRHCLDKMPVLPSSGIAGWEPRFEKSPSPAAHSGKAPGQRRRPAAQPGLPGQLQSPRGSRGPALGTLGGHGPGPRFPRGVTGPSHGSPSLPAIRTRRSPRPAQPARRLRARIPPAPSPGRPTPDRGAPRG